MSELEPPAEGVACAECGRELAPTEDREQTDAGVFCRRCFDALRAEVEEVVARQGQGLNYASATVAAVIGGILGAAVWWGFTVLTEIAFGLVAVVIGFAVGKGALIGSGGARSTGLQMISTAVAGVFFFYASYLVNRTFLIRAFEADPNYEGAIIDVPLVPGLAQGIEIVSLSFGLMDLVFLAIVLYQAWKIPAPFRLPG